MEQRVWISYDPGVRGDYDRMYSWLDDHRAKECVDNPAFFDYDCGTNLVQYLKDDLGKALEVNKRTGVYAVWRDPKTEKMRGRLCSV